MEEVSHQLADILLAELDDDYERTHVNNKISSPEEEDVCSPLEEEANGGYQMLPVYDSEDDHELDTDEVNENDENFAHFEANFKPNLNNNNQTNELPPPLLLKTTEIKSAMEKIVIKKIPHWATNVTDEQLVNLTRQLQDTM